MPSDRSRPSGPVPGSALPTDLRWMSQALRAARGALRRGEVPVGAVLVLDGELLARGANRTLAACDPSAHAEIVALRRGARLAANHRLSGASLYVTLEPCSMCLGALIQARICRLVYGAEDPKGGGLWLLGLEEFLKRSNHQFDVAGGVMATDSTKLLREFFLARRVRGRRNKKKAGALD